MSETIPRTKTDATGPNGWSIRDEPTQFREWGTNIIHPFPPRHVASTIGAAENTWLRLWDPSGRISKRHAVLTHGPEGWRLEDLASKNGIHGDGVRSQSLILKPGAEIRIGSTTLIVESPKLMALREFLERILGWAEERREEVDQALASVRIAITHREPLLLCGRGNLAPTARVLHEHALGDRPFVAYMPPATGMDALGAAAGGTLCVSRERQPQDMDEVVSAMRGPLSQAFLIICAQTRPRGDDIVSQVVSVVRSVLIPPLADRGRELRRVIDAYAADAVAAFGGGGITATDREWIASDASATLHQVWNATRRIVALNARNGSVNQAARLLSMAHGSLSGWLARRTLHTSPMSDEDDDDTNEAES